MRERKKEQKSGKECWKFNFHMLKREGNAKMAKSNNDFGVILHPFVFSLRPHFASADHGEASWQNIMSYLQRKILLALSHGHRDELLLFAV
jgi:hypothetical protein